MKKMPVLKWMCAAAMASALAAPALAQDVKTDLPDRPMKQIKTFDAEAIKEGIRTTGQSGLCTATFTVAANGKAKNITADCPSPDFVPYVVRAVEGAEWEAEVVGGYFFENEVKQAFRFGSATAVDPRGEKGPNLVKGLQQRDIDKALETVKQEGSCDLKYTVGADGKPKDIVPNCTPAAFDPLITEAVQKMEFQPGLKDGQPTDWPGIASPMKLTKPNN